MNKTILTVAAAAVVIALAAYGIFSGQNPATDANSTNPAAGEAVIEQTAEGTPSQAQPTAETAPAAEAAAVATEEAVKAEAAAEVVEEKAAEAVDAAKEATDAAVEAEKAAE